MLDDICGGHSDSHVQFLKMGIDTINRASKNRGDTLVANVGDYVHTLCRKEYIHVWYISNEANKEHVPTPSRTRSSTPTFEFKTKCFLCGCGVTAREENFKQSSEVLSKNTEIDDSIKEASRNRSYDDWSLTVLGRLEGISDLHAAEAIYHHACYSNFKTNKNLPQKYQQVLKAGSKRGRPKNVVLENI